MPFSIQTKYHENSFKQGDVVAIRPKGFEYFEGDCLKKWLAAGRLLEDWRYTFAITYCTNPEMDGAEPEVQALLEEYDTENPLSEFKRRRYLSVPLDYNDHNRVELRTTGETSADWNTIEALIVERD